MKSEPLKRFLATGEKPRTQREISSLLDQSRNIILSQTTKPNQAMTDSFINSLSEEDIASITASKTGTLDRLHTAYLAKQGKPAPRKSTMTLFHGGEKFTDKASYDAARAKSKTAAARPAPAPVATSKPAPVVHIAKHSSTSTKPATPAPTVTASDFATKPLVMRKTDFDSLAPADKSRFSVAGGRLV
jgi:hypothetical protein